MILIEPQWNVDLVIKNNDNKFMAILIEPQWNVDKLLEIQFYIAKQILIEPQWNVDLDETKEAMFTYSYFNRTIVECRFFNSFYIITIIFIF